MTTETRNLADVYREGLHQRIIATCQMVQSDMAADVQRMDGQHASGKVLGEMHGNLAAAISALAGMVSSLAAELDADRLARLLPVSGGNT